MHRYHLARRPHRTPLFCLVAVAAGAVSANAQPTTAPATREAATATQPHGRLPGFSVSAHFDEQIKTYTFEPGALIHINAPSAARFDPAKPTTIAIYALPNGNTTAQTIGRKPGPDVDWHFGIQHIGAQTRCLREVLSDENLVVAYVEADTRSWPRWKSLHENYRTLLPKIVESIRSPFAAGRTSIVLTGHSGGGSFVLGYIDSVERIGNDVKRIAFLDSNYGYSDESGHGDKLIVWLKAAPDHYLNVLAYDDRDVLFNGKPIVSPTGGTFRATQRMRMRLEKDIPLTETPCDGYTRYHGLAGRVELIVHANPDNRILHTALVGDMSGFIHTMTAGTPAENKAGRFKGPIPYTAWIQPD
ncbi:MAG: hypothetical protein JXA69_17760 [Phycisphaerae bacterium]|nr:hypothetical protein [Phycisphaerae bacterium]